VKIIPSNLVVPNRYLGDKESVAKFMKLLIESEDLPEGVFSQADDGSIMIEGSNLFKLKDTYGLPLEMSIDIVMTKGLKIRWISFIEAARRNKWWDFQTYEVLEHALQDAGCERDYTHQVMQRFKQYVVTYKHPEMT
jgi:alanyl-tRNA synthetase